MKSVYILELRQKVNQHKNETICPFGAFSSQEKALEFILKEGKTTANEFDCKTGFYAILEYQIDSKIFDTGVFVSAYDFLGNKINIFGRK